MKSNYKPIGDFIQLVDNRNKALKKLPLIGVTVNKKFIPSVANTIGTNMKNYKLIRKNQFACSLMQVRRDGKIPVALMKEDEAIISQAYPVFEIMDTDKLLPQYLMMWMSRSEFDREACFYAVGGVRGSLEWEDFCAMQLPVPSAEKQKEIVKEYHTIEKRIQLNEQLNQKLEETAQAIYKEWFVDFGFPDENGKPYKSSGGKMVYCDELGVEIPMEWDIQDLVKLSTIKSGKRLPKGKTLVKDKTNYPYTRIANLGSFKYTFLSEGFEYLNENTQKQISKYTVSINDLIISIVGTIGVVKIIDSSLDGANLTENCMKVIDLEKVSVDYLYYYLNSKIGQKEIENRTVGGVQGKLPMYNIESLRIICPNRTIMTKFDKLVKSISNTQKSYIFEFVKLFQIRDILLAKMATIKD